MRIKVRKYWGVLKPVTKIKPNDKKYNRKKGKREVKKQIQGL